MLIKSIRFPLPLSLQLPGATDEVLSSSMSKLPSYPAPSCIPTGQGHLSTLWGIAQVLRRSLSCSLAPSYLRSLLLLTRPLGKQALLTLHPTPGHQGCLCCPQAASPRESGSSWGWGRNGRLCAHVIAVLSLVTQAWKGHCLSPEAHHVSQKQLCRSQAEPSPSLQSSCLPFFSMGTSAPNAFIFLILRDETTCASIPAKRTRPTRALGPANSVSASRDGHLGDTLLY